MKQEKIYTKFNQKAYYKNIFNAKEKNLKSE